VTWDPHILYVANVKGRALLSDGFILAEWRQDPWKGFDPDEGIWRRVGRHHYEPRRIYGDDGARAATYVDARKSLRCLPPGPARHPRIAGVGVPVVPGQIVTKLCGWGQSPLPVVPFESGVFTTCVDRARLAHFVHLIDGDPTRWTCAGPEKPVDAWDRARWLGGIMPMRVREGS